MIAEGNQGELWMLGIFLGLFGLAFGALARYNWKHGRPSRDWPKTRGRVVISESRRTGDDSKPRVGYAYTVNRTRYECEQISFRGKSGFETVGQVLARYPIGADVDVYYDAKKPERAVLEPGVGFTDILLPAVVALASVTAAIAATIASFLA